MPDISRSTLFGKLSPEAYQGLEGATLFCRKRGNPYVELAHWLHQLLSQPDNDLQRILRHFSVDTSALARDLIQSLDRLPRGATAITDLAVQVEDSVERGWVYASLLFGESRVRTGHLLVGWLKTTPLRNALGAISRTLAQLSPNELADNFAKITEGSPEQKVLPLATGPAPDSAPPGTESSSTTALARFSIDLTERARKGELDPIVGRDDEIRQIVQVLMRRRQNNPILAGEAGVGKTAVVEGFAQRVAAGDVPPSLKGVSVRVLDLGLLQAGASMKGEFEGRLRQVVDEVQASPTPIILFIDEAHTLIGAGGTQGTGDAANLLKPALARGTLRTIAATTWAEYKKYIESDPALTRRFQVIRVEEPDERRALQMMRGVASALEGHHRVQVLDEALSAAVTLSHRFIPDRQLPDKSVSLLDTACARVAVSQHGVPPEVETIQRRIEALRTELEVLERERALGVEVGTRPAEVTAQLQTEQESLTLVERRWHEERSLVEQILALRRELRGRGASPDSTPPPAAPAAAQTPRSAELLELERLNAQLKTLQGEAPLVLPTVDRQAVAAVVSDWTGIPTGRMGRSELETVLNLPAQLSQRVMGQDHALQAIARRVQTSRAGLENPSKPVGVFLLAGPSGVGKTETALALAEALYGGEQNLITINMSEFQEAHTVSTLKGAPPGYVGYGEGGVLTEAVRRRPYSVVLLDEVEKAHPDVHEVFFQVFDKGVMEDGQGTRVDFRNTLILLTSNVGSDLMMSLCQGPERPPIDALTSALRPALLEAFPAALLGRMVVIPYYPLDSERLGQIVRLQLGRIAERVKARYGVPLQYDAALVDLVTARCTEVESGGRMIDAVLTNSLLPELSRELLIRTIEGRPVSSVGVSARGGQFSYSFD